MLKKKSKVKTELIEVRAFFTAHYDDGSRQSAVDAAVTSMNHVSVLGVDRNGSYSVQFCRAEEVRREQQGEGGPR